MKTDLTYRDRQLVLGTGCAEVWGGGEVRAESRALGQVWGQSLWGLVAAGFQHDSLIAGHLGIQSGDLRLLKKRKQNYPFSKCDNVLVYFE